MSVCAKNINPINLNSIDVDIIMRETFTKETNCLYRILYNYIESSAFNIKMSDDFKKDMPSYMLNMSDKYCYDCASICILNEYLNRWRVYINNKEDLVGFKYEILKNVSDAKKSINERFIFMGNEKYWYLCGCSNKEKMYVEDFILQEYIKNNKEDLTLVEDFEREHKINMNWRTNFYTELYNLDQHIHYYKTTPHTVYRGKVLSWIIEKTNNDCSGGILEYL
jgi:hypothetical protein